MINLALAVLLVGCSRTQSEQTAMSTSAPLKPVLGYVGDFPAAFIQSESGLVIEITKATYAEAGALEGYKAVLKDASGEFIELEFYDFVHTATGLVDGYTTSVGGSVINGPSKQEFENAGDIGTRIAFAPDRFLPALSVGRCTGQSVGTRKYAYTEGGVRQVTSHEFTCPDQRRTYNLHYSEYTYDEIGRLSGFSVRVEFR